MISVKYNSQYKKDNVRQLRRMLKMTQKEFIEYFLSTETGKPTMSIATLSNLESKGGDRINDVINSVCLKLGMDNMMFSLPPEEFIDRAELFCENSSTDLIEVVRGNEKNGNIGQLVNRLTMYLAEEILEGRLKRGDQIPSDRELASKLGVGRSAVREALKILDVLGMIDIRLGQGTYIANRESDFFSIPLSWSLFLDGKQVDSIIQVRSTLEECAAELAAQCASETKLSKLTDIYYRMQQSFDRASSSEGEDIQRALQETLESDIEFHLCIAECSGNPIILSMLKTIRNFLKVISGTGMVNFAQMQTIFEEHRMLYGAIISHNPEGAREAMKKHMANANDRYAVEA